MKIAPFKLERFYSHHEFTAKYLLCSSDSESMTINELLSMEEGAHEKFLNHWLGYTETTGAPWLREEISKLYGSTSAEEILVHAGAQEAIFLTIHALLNAGDHVIVQYPCYQSFVSVPESIGCSVSHWAMEYINEKWEVNIEKLKNLIQPTTKLLIINSPHNPTGYQFTKSEIIGIISLARKNNIIILSDEVYKGMEHYSELKVPAFCDMYEKAISLNVISKSYGLPGLRIGWLASPQKNLLKKIWIYKEYTTICNSAPSEFLAGVALRNGGEILKRNLAIVKCNLTYLVPFFEKHSQLFSWDRPNAGVTAFVKIRNLLNDEKFCQQVLEERNVLLLPGTIYDYKGFFRIGFARRNMPEALEQFDQFLSKFKNPIHAND